MSDLENIKSDINDAKEDLKKAREAGKDTIHIYNYLASLQNKENILLNQAISATSPAGIHPNQFNRPTSPTQVRTHANNRSYQQSSSGTINKFTLTHKTMFANRILDFDTFLPKVTIYFGIGSNALNLSNNCNNDKVIDTVENNYEPTQQDYKCLISILDIEEKISEERIEEGFTLYIPESDKMHYKQKDSSEESPFSFPFSTLIDNTEENVQKFFITPKCCNFDLLKPHLNHNCKWIDTHSKPHNVVCVSLNDSIKNSINFQAKPDAVSCIFPLYIDVKDSKDRKVKTLLESDYELLNQGIERCLQTIEFRCYLSKFVVVLSNGTHSFILFYQHKIDSYCDHTFQINIIPIKLEQINTFLISLLKKAEKQGPTMYLTEHGPIILRTIEKLLIKESTFFRNIYSPYKVRVQFLSSSVYYITFPKGKGNIPTGVQSKTFVFKVIMNEESFQRESKILSILKPHKSTIESIFSNLSFNGKREKNFYFYRSYPANYFSRNPSSSTSRFVWFESLPNIENNSGGIVISYPGDRSYPSNLVSTAQLKDDLQGWLNFIHNKGIAHTDIRPNNIVYFSNIGFQIIDFDNAIIMNENLPTRIQKDSSQYYFSSKRVKEIGSKVSSEGWYEVNYSLDDDKEMLSNAIDYIVHPERNR